MRKNAQNSSVDGQLGLNIRATHYVPDRAESRGLWSNVASVKAGSYRGLIHRNYHNAKLLVAHELHQPGDDASFHNHFDAVVIAVCEIRDGPARVGQDVIVGEMEQLDQRGKHLWNR